MNEILDDIFIPYDPWDGVRNAVRTLQKACNDAAHKAGWYTDPVTGKPRPVDTIRALFLMVSEIVEAGEAFRTDAMDDKLPQYPGVDVELCDLLIRAFNFAGATGINLADPFMLYNETREDHKPENRAKPGGKKF